MVNKTRTMPKSLRWSVRLYLRVKAEPLAAFVASILLISLVLLPKMIGSDLVCCAVHLVQGWLRTDQLAW